MRKMSLLGVMLLAAGCGPDLEASCQNYLDAYFACADAAFEGDDGTLETTKATLDGYCSVYEGYKGSEAKDAAELLDCYADAYSAADCTTVEGFAAAGTDIGSCGS